MKFSTGSSSSSLASDSLSRKSTLCIYTEVDVPAVMPTCERMDSSSEAMELRRELDAVRNALQQQSESVLKQRHQLVEANQALAARGKETAQERKLRKDQLALVLRSLVLLESRLTREQKQIHVALQQKEKIIKSQQEEIAKLKARKSYCSNCQQLLGFTSEQTNIETDPEFQSLESTDSRFQNTFVRSCSYRERNSPPVFQKNTRLSKSFQLPKSDVVYGNTSSSEEGNNASLSSKGTFIKNKQAFVRRDVFRRSRKYSGRKNNKYADNLQKCYNNQVNNSSSAEECLSMSYQVNQDDNDITASQIANDIRRASLKIDQLIGEAAKKQLENNTSDSEKTYSTKMERIHGIKRQGSDEIKANRQLFLNNVLNDEKTEKPWYCNVSDQEQETDCLEQSLSLSNKSKSADDLLTVGYNDRLQPIADVVSAKNEILCNSMLKHTNNEMFGTGYDDKNNNIESSLNKQAATAEINENWYASTSDADECPTNEIYKNNPVLECVNQILLQNSLDDSSNDNSKSSETPSPKATTKRVQFSTLNSISYDDKLRPNNTQSLPRPDKRLNKIVKFSLETASEHSYEVPNTAQGFQYEVQSIYSNEYEPIVTKSTETKPVPLPRSVNSSEKSNVPKIRGSIVKNIAATIESRHNNSMLEKNVDSDSATMKIFNKRKVPRTPPALPPKPKNLSAKWKAENSVKSTTEPLDSEAVAAIQRVADVKMRKVGQVATVNDVEPDYCSISEINVPVVSTCKRELLLTQPTVEIHNEQYPMHAIGQRNSVAKVVSLPRIQNKISDKDIPKLPQVTEIIIPDEDDKPNEDQNISFHKTTDSYLNNFTMHPLQPKLDPRASIQMGNTVSSILSEINKGGKIGGKQINLTELDHQFNRGADKIQPNAEIHKAEYFEDVDKFDLSQNFEEFKIDDELGSIVAEEYRISSGSSDGSMSDVITDQVTSVTDKEKQHNIKNNGEIKDITLDNQDTSSNKGSSKNAKLSNKPDLLSNIENLETESVRNSDIESSNSSGSNSGSYNTVKCEPRMVLNNQEKTAPKMKGSFDFFLETSGLSSKSIFTPSKNYLMRPPSANHKNVLKPKDVKMRVKNSLTTNKLNEKPMTTAIKYFEPYV
ncbi:hypothetical protein O3G_MSEX006254 [Manduca sexta]|uniref:Uncharacterized protein n=2 Tax=Manduca sexta TaxID=7130 RepID=A0A921Z3Y8_MANSE|nr:hypothetical protein O3G_MSEX006254 [Manduca sexta]KAG6449852.1 hypothetical protein O3G_MSEX006254 [Manduca sexta]KAG6449853.1 hypothetical protein O3G_MSEX006254 [Manduca sexta]